MYTTSTPPTVVVVGNYRVGKSSFVKALLGDLVNTNQGQTSGEQSKHHGNRLDANKETPPSSSVSSSSHNNELQMDHSELIVEARSIFIDSEEVRIIDTAARDVQGTQQEMQSADLVIVLMNAYLVFFEENDDLDEYWIDQFADISLYSPIIAVFNQCDRLSSDELHLLQSKLRKPTREHFVLERIEYVSATTFSGISECKLSIISVLRSVRNKPRWILIDPYSWKLQPLFECGLQRIFRLLDRDCDEVLNFAELEYFNRVCLNEEFTANLFSLLLQRLNEQNDSFATLQGLTFCGFRHLMKRFAIAKKWDRCWDVLRFFHYKNDLTLHERVFPQLPSAQLQNASIELTSHVYVLLEKLFNKYADDTIIDVETKSIASSMISSQITPASGGANTTNQIYIDNDDADDDDDDSEDDDDDDNKVLSYEGLSNLLCVLPSTRAELHCTLLDQHVIDHFETAGRKLNKLTKNGWLSFWAMFAVENGAYCFQQLTYLDLSSDSDRNLWWRIVENHGVNNKQALNKSVIRILLFGGPQCGKSVFCDRLLCRIPAAPRTHSSAHKQHKATHSFRAVSNRIGASNEYNFLAITEVPAITQHIEQAMDNFLNSYDMILFQFDLSEARSFYELNKIFDRMPKNHLLPIQVLATKADLNHVEQINLDVMQQQQQQQQQRALAATVVETDEKSNNINENAAVYHNINQSLNEFGLYPYAQTWLTHNDSCDFPQLFDDIFFIATHPHFRRLKVSKHSSSAAAASHSHNNNNNSSLSKIFALFPSLSKNVKTILKRTVTITVSVSIVLYSAYKIYKLFAIKSPPLKNVNSNTNLQLQQTQHAHAPHHRAHQLRRFRR